MQKEENPFPHKARSARTRKDLIDVAALLFARNPYDQVSTPQIVGEAGLTRGALYYHFADKLEIFAAVVGRESAEVAAWIREATTESESALDAFLKGADAYFAAMAADKRILKLCETRYPSTQLMRQIKGVGPIASITIRSRGLPSNSRTNASRVVLIERSSETCPSSSSRHSQLFRSPRSIPTTAAIRELSAIRTCCIWFRMVVFFMAALTPFLV